MNRFPMIGPALVLYGALALGSAAHALEVAGVKLDDATRVANQDLRLNGAGVRYKVVFKVYVAALYLPEKKAAAADALAAPGARRVTIVMLRDVGSEEFGQAFIAGIQNNTDRAERTALAGPLARFSEMFGTVQQLKAGDTLLVDWLPGSGMVVHLNGKKILESIPDLAFYNAVLRIWLGDNPVDGKLKRQLLGEQ